MKRQIADYHRYYALINRGDFHRLILPDDRVNSKSGRAAAWMVVSEDKSEALVTFVVIRTSIHPVYFLRLRGLDPAALYEDGEGHAYRGDSLMRAGLNLTKNYRDGESVVIHLTRRGA